MLQQATMKGSAWGKLSVSPSGSTAFFSDLQEAYGGDDDDNSGLDEDFVDYNERSSKSKIC